MVLHCPDCRRVGEPRWPPQRLREKISRASGLPSCSRLHRSLQISIKQTTVALKMLVSMPQPKVAAESLRAFCVSANVSACFRALHLPSLELFPPQHL